MYNFGPPVYVLTDNGTQFASKFFSEACQILGIGKLFTTSYHPLTNGQAERFNRTILNSLRSYVAEHQRDWDAYSSLVTYGYNCQIHRSTGVAPLELVLSRPSVNLSLENVPSWEEKESYRIAFL